MEHCQKCDGFGILPEYSNLKNGVCFECGGVKTRTESIKEFKKAQKENDREQKEKEVTILNLEKLIYSIETQLEEAKQENDLEAVEYFTNRLTKKIAQLEGLKG